MTLEQLIDRLKEIKDSIPEENIEKDVYIQVGSFEDPKDISLQYIGSLSIDIY